MSTIRSFSTGSPRIGSIVTFGPTSSTSTLHARALRPLISIASEPQMPWAHDRRKLSVPSWYHFTWCSTSTRRSSGSACTVNSSHQESCETSGLNRRICSGERDLCRCGAAGPPAVGVLQHVGRRRHQYFLSMGT